MEFGGDTRQGIIRSTVSNRLPRPGNAALECAAIDKTPCVSTPFNGCTDLTEQSCKSMRSRRLEFESTNRIDSLVPMVAQQAVKLLWADVAAGNANGPQLVLDRGVCQNTAHGVMKVLDHGLRNGFRGQKAGPTGPFKTRVAQFRDCGQLGQVDRSLDVGQRQRNQP